MLISFDVESVLLNCTFESEIELCYNILREPLMWATAVLIAGVCPLCVLYV